MVTTIVVVISMKDNKTTNMDATKSEMFMRDLNPMMQERIMLEMIMEKYVIDVAEGHWSQTCRTEKNLVDL